MRLTKFLTAVALIVALAGISALWVRNSAFSSIHTYRYRITIEVSARDAVHSGSSVIQVRLDADGIRLPESSAVSTTTLGEATFVDLGEGRNLIALLASGATASDVDFPARVILSRLASLFSGASPAKFPDLAGSWDLAEDQFPTFITFDDVRNPATARIVVPSDFERVFGPATRLRRVRIEITNDPVTWSIQTHLPWWTDSGRPAAVARQSLLSNSHFGPSIEPEMLFKRGAPMRGAMATEKIRGFGVETLAKPERFCGAPECADKTTSHLATSNESSEHKGIRVVRRNECEQAVGPSADFSCLWTATKAGPANAGIDKKLPRWGLVEPAVLAAHRTSRRDPYDGSANPNEGII
ncbi:hypothetical protein MXD81_05955 [Microbacteriaceae bacterium K1510]|nr:hypothetical protein [Microbacteriaceae bacterium K1510]